MVNFKRKVRVGGVRKIFGDWHAEAGKSNATLDYVWKEETRIEGTQFELGTIPRKRGTEANWDTVRDLAKSGKFEDIPSDIYIRYFYFYFRFYGNLHKIAVDHLQPAPIERKIYCFWGSTGTGKSRRAWEEAGVSAYPKGILF